MTYLFSEILGSLVLVAALAFTFGWFLRGVREQLRKRSELSE